MPDGNILTSIELPTDADLRLNVLEMTIAAIAAQLPDHAFGEIVSLLVFIAKGGDAASAASPMPLAGSRAEAAGAHATRMLEVIAKARRPGRPHGPTSHS